jgi:hypothetical protein
MEFPMSEGSKVIKYYNQFLDLLAEHGGLVD